MKIVEKDPRLLTPYGNNPRRNASAVAAVVASLKAFGAQQPIVVDKNGVVIVGHTRRLAAIELQWATYPTHYATNLTDAQVTAYRLADNKTGEIAEWDEEKLFEELSLIAGEGFDLEGMGFTTEDMQQFEAAARKPDFRYLEDFEVMPKPKPKWILISVAEDDAAVLLSTIRSLELDSVKMEYSGEPSK
jgi:ParB-like chromosome segregation protein Spo0J